MASIAEMRKAAILAVYRAASEIEDGFTEFTGAELKSLIGAEVGHAFASGIFRALQSDGLFSQTQATADGSDGRWELTVEFINEANSLLSEKGEVPAENANSNNFGTYADFKDHLLIEIADYEESEGPNVRYNYEPAEVAAQAGLSFKPGWVRKAVTSFGDYGYVKTAFTMGGGEDGGLACALTGEGLEEAERLRRERQPAISSSATSGSIDIGDLWSPLPLEVAVEEREEIANELEGLRNEVRSSNGYASTYPAEHSNIVWALGSAVNGFREGLFTRYLIEMCVFRPLGRLIEVFPEAAIQITAQAILIKIIELFRSFLTQWGLL